MICQSLYGDIELLNITCGEEKWQNTFPQHACFSDHVDLKTETLSYHRPLFGSKAGWVKEKSFNLDIKSVMIHFRLRLRLRLRLIYLNRITEKV